MPLAAMRKLSELPAARWMTCGGGGPLARLCRLVKVMSSAVMAKVDLGSVRLNGDLICRKGERSQGDPAARHVDQPWVKSRSSDTSPSVLKRNSDTPARFSLPPSFSLVCALQGTAAWSPSTIGVPNWH